MVSTRLSKHYKKCFDNNVYEIYSRFNLGIGIIEKSWWIENYDLVVDTKNYGELREITLKIGKNVNPMLFHKIMHTLFTISSIATESRIVVVTEIIFSFIQLNNTVLNRSPKFTATTFRKAILGLSQNLLNPSRNLVINIIENCVGSELKRLVCVEIKNNLDTIQEKLNEENQLKVMDYYIRNH